MVIVLFQVGWLTSRVLEENFIVQAQPKFRHSRQEYPHLHTANDFRSKNISIRTDKKVDGFDDIQKYLVQNIDQGGKLLERWEGFKYRISFIYNIPFCEL